MDALAGVVEPGSDRAVDLDEVPDGCRATRERAALEVAHRAVTGVRKYAASAVDYRTSGVHRLRRPMRSRAKST